MSAENGSLRGGQPTDTARLYALLYQLSADVARLEKLVRAMKKTIEEKRNEQ